MAFFSRVKIMFGSNDETKYISLTDLRKQLDDQTIQNYLDVNVLDASRFCVYFSSIICISYFGFAIEEYIEEQAHISMVLKTVFMVVLVVFTSIFIIQKEKWNNGIYICLVLQLFYITFSMFEMRERSARTFTNLFQACTM